MGAPDSQGGYLGAVTHFVAEVDPWSLAGSAQDAAREYEPHVRALLMWNGPVTAWWVIEVFGGGLYPSIVDRIVDGVAGIRSEHALPEVNPDPEVPLRG